MSFFTQPNAFDKFFNDNHQSIINFVRSIVDHDAQAEDIVADTFVALSKALNDFDSYESAKAFMYTTCRNKALNYLKHIKRATISHNEIRHLSNEFDNDNIEAKIIKSELLHEVLKHAHKLPDSIENSRKKIFFMYYVEGIDYNEIAASTGISIDTVRVQIKRALDFLRKRISFSYNPQSTTTNQPIVENEIDYSKTITHNGCTKLITDWCKELKLNRPTVMYRINNGATAKQALAPTSHGIFYKGNHYNNLKQLCKSLKINYNSIISRTTRLGWNIEKALNEPIRKSRNKNTSRMKIIKESLAA